MPAPYLCLGFSWDEQNGARSHPETTWRRRSHRTKSELPPKELPWPSQKFHLQILHNKTSKEASILSKLKYRNGAVKRTLSFYSALFGCGVAAKGAVLLWQNCPKPSQQTLSLWWLQVEEARPCLSGLQDLFPKAKHFKRFNEIKLWRGLSPTSFHIENAHKQLRGRKKNKTKQTKSSQK